jgi:very-short-patch-repair endonuclease
MDEEFRIAERQYGVVTRAQLRALGLSDSQIQRRIATRRIEGIFPGVFRVVGSVATRRQRALGACLWLGDPTAVSHTTAGALLRLDGIETDELHVSILATERRGRGGAGIIVHRTISLPSRERRYVDHIPCTSAARTLVDIAPMVEDEALEAAFESARRMGLATVASVIRAQADFDRRPGAVALHRVIERAARRPLESRLEVKLGRLLARSPLPPSEVQYRIGSYRVDRAWPAHRVAVEADGFHHHGKRLEWKRDRQRIATIEAKGWRIVRLTWDDVTRQATQTVDRIAFALGILAV